VFRSRSKKAHIPIAQVAFPIHEYGSSVIQKVIDSELVQGKDRQMHKGYIRVYVIGDKFLGAWYRMPQTAQTNDEFIDITKVKTSFNPVDDVTLDQLKALCLNFVDDYESAFIRLNISNVPDLIRFRNRKIDDMIHRNMGAAFDI
jgi:hypothetical protein